MSEGIAALLNDSNDMFFIKTDKIDWPTGREHPTEIGLERSLSRRLKDLGFRLVADRTLFTDAHYMGGYMIVSQDRIQAGRDFELSLMDVLEWVQEQEQGQEQRQIRKRA